MNDPDHQAATVVSEHADGTAPGRQLPSWEATVERDVAALHRRADGHDRRVNLLEGVAAVAALVTLAAGAWWLARHLAGRGPGGTSR